MQINVDLIYPIGSIYMTTSTISPAVLFGGKWERIKGRCIVGVDENDTDFNKVSKIGGEKTHTLTKTEIPNHIHYGASNSQNDGFMMHATGGSGFTILQQSSSGYGVYLGGATNSFGDMGNGAHNNLQPYYTAYIWRRTA